MAYTLVQLSDCHLGKQQGDKLLGLDTDLSLSCVLAQLHSDFTRADALICSGDLSNDSHSPLPYLRLAQYLTMPWPQYWLPGNHDNNTLMLSSLTKQQFLGSFALGNWQITLLDSSVEGAVFGRLAMTEVERALDILTRYPEKHHLFFLHHPLAPIGCQWLDLQRVANGDEVLATLAHYPQLKMIVTGHVHQESMQQFAHIHLYSTPSTCVQFKPMSDEFAVGAEMPGYRWFVLEDDGQFNTGVKRIAQREFAIDFQSKGY